ncbi:MAG: mechanosensitive ion channel family protein [Gammaproteobacteria bacterium]|nr:mechanosensitive ion channel family protein [Gammaproteobacteria bacterium]
MKEISEPKSGGILAMMETTFGSISELVPALFTGIMIFLLFWLVATGVRSLLRHIAQHRDAERQNVLRLIQQLVYVSLLIVGLVTALGTAGVDVSALVTSLGLVGFALGFALKDALSNLISGVLLLLYRPFGVGDEIVIGGYEGRVTSIDLRYTTLQLEQRSVFIPNSRLFTESVVLKEALGDEPPSSHHDSHAEQPEE